MFSCDHCEYQIASSKIMDIHKRTFHDKEKKYNCDLWGHQVSHRNSLARHKKIVHEEATSKGTLHSCSTQKGST